MYANAYHSNSLDHEQTLTVASVFKGVFSIDWLMDLLDEKRPSQILAQLEEGVKEGWLIKKEPGFYSFRDERKQVKWKSHLSPKEERELHRHIADILMLELPDDETKAHILAHHLVHVRNDTESCRYLVRAGDLHLKAFRTEDALQCYSKVLDDLSCLRGEEEDRLFSQTAVKYSKISTARHDTAKVLTVLQSALERAKNWDMQSSEALLKMHMAKNEWLRSRYRSALRCFEDGWSLAVALNDPKLLLSATTFSTFFLFWQGRFRDAVHIYEKSVPDIEKYPRGGLKRGTSILLPIQGET